MENNWEKIYRLNPLVEALKSSSERINKIFIQRDKKNRKISEIIHSAKDHHIPLFFVPK
ncbi:MAG: RNA methyltransferase substrate-binding domain-containing protein, partial [Candidatus Aminicenantales bacterium]